MTPLEISPNFEKVVGPARRPKGVRLPASMKEALASGFQPYRGWGLFAARPPHVFASVTEDKPDDLTILDLELQSNQTPLGAGKGWPHYDLARRIAEYALKRHRKSKLKEQALAAEILFDPGGVRTLRTGGGIEAPVETFQSTTIYFYEATFLGLRRRHFPVANYVACLVFDSARS